MKKTRVALFNSLIALVLCFSMLVGTTYAWFTDTETSAKNIIQAGNLDIEMYWNTDMSENWINVSDKNTIFDYDKWEPGYTEVRYVKIANEGNLAFKYAMKLLPLGNVGPLAGVIDVYYVENPTAPIDGRAGLAQLTPIGTLAQVLEGQFKTDGTMLAEEKLVVGIALKMQERAGNEFMGLSIGDSFSIQLVATQLANEEDAFGDDYDSEDKVTPVAPPMHEVVSSTITATEGKLDTAVEMSGSKTSASIPAGVAVAEGADKLALSVSELNTSSATVVVGEGETAKSADVHVDGVAKDNKIPMAITLKEFAPKGLNSGNLKLFHVEEDGTKEMTEIALDAAFTAHNQFKYDPATGDVTVNMATFSEVALVADTVNAWAGKFDYTWYDASKTELTIANADQLAGFGAIVGGMAKDKDGNFLITYTDSDGDEHHNDSFSGKTVKLISDINLGDVETENKSDIIFYPIGYWNNEGTYEKLPVDKRVNAVSSGFYAFEGTFDGNGNTIKNFYQNTWEMKGDHDWYDIVKDQYFRDGFGLFGKVYGGTVKNLIVDNYSCDSEIGTTGVIAAYADSKNGQSAVFENITITNCNPRVYNIGNGGIVGCAGWYSRNESLGDDDYDNAVTFRNITVDQTNKISALWGSWGVSCAGILGQYYPNSACGIKLENCHVAAKIDVNNDVCSNYQYYWYRYAGVFIGTIRANTKEAGYEIADTTGVSATGCTYTMGNWNEYWYCEIVANSLASYTHDHQFSRLDNITDIKEIQNADDTWKKEGHFALLSADRKSVECYHIFKDSNGNLYRHLHDVADESNPKIYEDFDLDGNGKLDDLKEDRQRYFLPFNQLFTGLDMGIKAHTEFEGITFVEDGTVKSEEKFKSLENAITTYKPGQTITLGELVEATVDESKIAKATLYAAVSPADGNDNTKVNATFSLDAGDWKNSSITFGEDCTGAVKIVITDYFYCTPTVITLNESGQFAKFEAKTVGEQNAYTQITLGDLFTAKDGVAIGNVTATVTDPNGNVTTLTGEDWTTKTIDLIKDGKWTVSIVDDDKYCATTSVEFTVNKADKFTKKFDKDFLYRVGNAENSPVGIGYIFGEVETAVKLSAVDITIENVAGNAAGTFESASPWTSGTIQFTGTGVVKVTISADCVNPVELCLEVVDAVNATSATSATSNNVVLLNNCGFGSLEVSGGYTLYGNGFTMTCGSDSAALNTGYEFVAVNNGILDNVQIVCPNFDYAVLYSSNMTESGNRSETTDKTRYFNVKSAVEVSGDSQILNSRISGGRAAVNITNGNVIIDNSRIELGAVASILVGSANSVTLRDVTLVQKPTASTHDPSKTIMGFSVLFICDADGNAAPVTIEGTLVQNAWADEGDNQYVPSAGQSVISTVLGKTEYLHDLDGDGTKESLNLGFAYMPESVGSKVNATTITDNRTNKDAVPYDYAEVSILNGKTYVYSYKNSNGTEDLFKTEAEYKPNKYSDIIAVTYSDDADGLETSKSFGTSGWVYELNVDLDKLSGYKLDFSKLSMTVNGVTVTDYKVNGNAKPTSPVTVTAGGVTYTFTATVNGKECITYLKVTGTETSKESPSLVGTPAYGEGFGVANSYNGDWSAAAPVLDGITIKYWSVAESAYKEFALSSITFANTGKQNGTNSYWEYSHSNNDFKLKLTNTVAIHDKSQTFGMPVVGKNGKLYFTIAGTGGFVGNGTSSRNITIKYEFTDNNGGDTLTFTNTWKIEQDENNQYNYNSFVKDGTLTKLESSSGCVSPDTLITLADGRQVRVDSLTGSEELLVWNLETGMLDSAPIMFIDSEEEAEYEIVHLYFSDGTDVKVIFEHGFWDYDLNKYVYLDENAADYIGHTFAKQNGDELTKVQLVDVAIETETTTAWSPVTSGHLCYFVNGMLSMPGGVGGLFNIFEIDAETMTYDLDAMARDIEKYGLYTYEELNAICPLSEDMFNAAGGAYLKVSIGKGNLTMEELINMITRYSVYFG